MDLSSHFANLNWIAIIAATVSAFILGGIWYAKGVFGGRWMQEIGLTEEDVEKGHMGKIFGTTFVLQFIAATTLAMLIGPNKGWLIGLHAGLIVGLIWVGSAIAINYLFEQRSLRLWFINAGYNVVLYSIMGIIIGVLG